jgi:hypothetical protein
MKLSPRILMVLNRRLDAEFLRMECAWAEYLRRRDDERRATYIISLTRADRLSKLIKNS